MKLKILYNANIYTQDISLPKATALAILGSKILAVGSDEQILTLADQNTEKMNLGGKTILPGLTDAHIHLENYALSLQIIDCETDTREECIRRVSEKARHAAPGTWILGHGWNQNNWAEGFGTAANLDEAAPDNPVYLTAKSLHAGWANSAALSKANIGPDTKDPVDGTIVRSANGQPTGILLESAMGLVEDLIPEASAEERYEAIRNAQTTLWQFGLTGAHDFDLPTCFSTLQKMAQNSELQLRVNKGIPLNKLDEAIALGIRSGFGNDLLRIGAVKMFADGAMGPRTAGMLQPFENEAEYTGELFMDAKTFFEHAKKASMHGFSVAIHAIGDRANREILNGYEQLRAFEKANHLAELRHRIEHVQILDPADWDRLAKLKIIGSVQPIHATSDIEISDAHLGNRAANAYVFRSLLDGGTRIAFGSDSPVESPNPFLGIHAAVTRRRRNGDPGTLGWHPEQRISLQEAIHAYTIGPAYACGMENKLGQLMPGFYADLIVLGQNPFITPAHDLQHIRPEKTMINGTWVWQS